MRYAWYTPSVPWPLPGSKALNLRTRTRQPYGSIRRETRPPGHLSAAGLVNKKLVGEAIAVRMLAR
jgi:hypothetical protein